MSRRYYVCDVIGDGSESNPYRAKLYDYAGKVAAHVPTDETNKPVHAWAIAIVEEVNHSKLSAIAGIDQLPDVSLDIKTSAVSTTARTQLGNMLSRRGITGVSISSADSYKDVIQGLGRNLSSSFDVDNFDIR